MLYASKFNLTGTDQQQAIVKSALDKIFFPWDKLKFPVEPVEIGWRDLNSGLYLNNPATHAIGGKLDKHAPVTRAHAREYIFGIMYPSTGAMFIDEWLVNRPDLAETTVSAEVAHNVDYFLPLTDSQKEQITVLMHAGDTVVHDHSWWEKVDYNGEYFTLVGEAFMQAFTLAYSDMSFDNSGFTHDITREQAPELRKIIGIDRTDVGIQYKTFPPSKVYHTLKHYTRKECVLITNTAGYRPCKICKP